MKASTKQSRRGFLLIDMVIGLLLLAVMTTVLAVGVRSRQKGSAHLTDTRAALRSAEAALYELQAGAPAPTSRKDVAVRIIDQQSDTAPAGHRWVRVEATCNGRSASLYGLIPSTNGGRQR
ncbi:MAG: type II secretion system protein [Anaerolineae bacterium]|nr:type II secretion system protein [Phycisphaerae bacterium]